MMREHRIIVPECFNDGTPHGMQAEFEAKAIGLFGGFTLWYGYGAWEDGDKVQNEPVAIYTFSSGRADDREKLYRLARWVKVRLGQQAVYIRHGDGEVEFWDGGE
jgi:hypothetical protein